MSACGLADMRQTCEKAGVNRRTGEAGGKRRGDNFWGQGRRFMCLGGKEDNSIATPDESRGRRKSSRGGWELGNKLEAPVEASAIREGT
jgi:hypothetical protein